MAVKVALAGATGNLGPAILSALLDAGFDVTVLSRKASSSTGSLPKHSNQSIIKVDYANQDELVIALKGINVVVSTLSSRALEIQKPLIDACAVAGVQRLIPSSFGSDMENSLNKALPVFKGKIATLEYVDHLVAKQSRLSYTYVYNNLFFDWGLGYGLVAKPKEHTATLWDGGDVPISMTTLATVGKAVVGIVNNLEATKNKTLYIHDTAISVNQIIEIAKGIDGKEWTTTVDATANAEKRAYEELNRKDGNVGQAMIGFIYRAGFSKEHGTDFTDKLDNEILGLSVMTEEEVQNVIRSSI